MSIFEKQRFEIWNNTQHPYKHTLADFGYSNPALPGITNLESTINWLVAIMYPNTKPAVATPAALPAGGNTINDYRVVLDDGDGKAAAYRWEQREGEAAPSWHKIYDMDWSQDSILAAFEDRTDDRYVMRRGRDDRDESGVVIAGLYAGQRIYGGSSPGTNLTLSANSGDGVGPDTGYVQVTDDFRPDADNSLDLGTAALKFKTLYLGTSALVSTLTIASGSITDSTGIIDFDNEDLFTSGDITGGIVTGTSLVADDMTDTITIAPGSITDTTGAISFGTADLSTSGTLSAGVTTLTDNAQTLVFDPEVAGKGSITSSTGTISFNDENLETTGSLNVGVITGTQLNIDNLRLDGNTISSTDLNGNIILLPNGTGVVDVQKTLQTLDQTVTGTVGITGQLNIDSLRLDGQTLSTTAANANLNLAPNGTGLVTTSASFVPTLDNVDDLGSAVLRFNDLFLGGTISDGTNAIGMAAVVSLRSVRFRDLAQTLPAQAGDALFYDAVNDVWLANHPDTEILHSEVSGLTTGDAGHTQFVMLAGRAGGQTIQGGTAASENLVLESTSHATKGLVLTKDNFVPFTNASYAGSWSGTDLGDSTHYFRDVYTKGEMKGMRFENYTSGTLPASSGQNVGRVVYATDNNKAYVDTGSVFKVLGVSKWVSDTVWNGSDVSKDIDVSAEITDARNALWQLRDNANNFEVMYVTIKATSASNVRIETNVALPAGSYRLIGVE